MDSLTKQYIDAANLVPISSWIDNTNTLYEILSIFKRYSIQ
jgi:hypothetical protein